MAKRLFKGTIVSDKMAKTVVVAVDVPKKHPVYSKRMKNTQRFKARNAIDAKLGDVVVIEECRPYSKEVVWEVVKVIEEEK